MLKTLNSIFLANIIDGHIRLNCYSSPEQEDHITAMILISHEDQYLHENKNIQYDMYDCVCLRQQLITDHVSYKIFADIIIVYCFYFNYFCNN